MLLFVGSGECTLETRMLLYRVRGGFGHNVGKAHHIVLRFDVIKKAIEVIHGGRATGADALRVAF